MVECLAYCRRSLTTLWVSACVQTRKRVLINAFTVRALRDGFAPARGAGIMALMATTEYYDATEIATRILPHLVVLTVDSDSDVRTKAFQATEVFLQAVKTYHSKVMKQTFLLSETPAHEMCFSTSCYTFEFYALWV
jgi:hypothetical protein